MRSLADYERCFIASFERFYGPIESWSLYGLLPSYLEREGSSLVYMAERMILRSRGGGLYLHDHDRLLDDMAADPGRKILLGVTYALLDLAEKGVRLPADTVIMETGGMKGRRKELPKEELHRILCQAFGTETIHSEYGMAELSSQAYSKGDGLFYTPPWMRVVIRDLNDPFEPLPIGRSGGINLIDLSNLHSCAFIQTDDLGRLQRDGGFRIEGRVKRSDIRGCNLLVQ